MGGRYQQCMLWWRPTAPSDVIRPYPPFGSHARAHARLPPPHPTPHAHLDVHAVGQPAVALLHPAQIVLELPVGQRAEGLKLLAHVLLHHGAELVHAPLVDQVLEPRLRGGRRRAQKPQTTCHGPNAPATCSSRANMHAAPATPPHAPSPSRPCPGPRSPCHSHGCGSGCLPACGRRGGRSRAAPPPPP